MAVEAALPAFLPWGQGDMDRYGNLGALGRQHAEPRGEPHDDTLAVFDRAGARQRGVVAEFVDRADRGGNTVQVIAKDPAIERGRPVGFELRRDGMAREQVGNLGQADLAHAGACAGLGWPAAQDGKRQGDGRHGRDQRAVAPLRHQGPDGAARTAIETDAVDAHPHAARCGPQVPGPLGDEQQGRHQVTRCGQQVPAAEPGERPETPLVERQFEAGMETDAAQVGIRQREDRRVGHVAGSDAAHVLPAAHGGPCAVAPARDGPAQVGEDRGDHGGAARRVVAWSDGGLDRFDAGKPRRQGIDHGGG